MTLSGKPVAAAVAERALLEPERVLMTFVRASEATAVTFGDLVAHGSRYAAALREKNVAEGDVVIVMLRHTPDLLYAFFGALLLGAVPSFMPFPSPKQDKDRFWDDHATLFGRVGPAVVVTFRENEAAASRILAPLGVPMLFPDDVPGAAVSRDDWPGLRAAYDSVACLQHSSGTTGLKKGVMLTHRAIAEQIASYAECLVLANDVIASWLPLYHDMGFIACFMLPMLTGTPVVTIDPFEWVIRPAMLFDAIERYRATLCWQPNFALSHLVNTVKPASSYDLRSMRAFINCSEPCKATSTDRFVERFAAFGVEARMMHACYAMAENVFAVTQTPLDREPARLAVDRAAFLSGRIVPDSTSSERVLLSCGPPIAGVQVRICDDAGREAAGDRIGEIRISSPFLFAGYHRLPDVTRQRLREGWYATGDLGFVHGGELYVTGRVDDMIIVNGRNYYAHEIEELVNRVEGLIPGRAVALSIEEEQSDAVAVAVMAEVADGSDRDALAAAIRREIFDRAGIALHEVRLLSPGALVKTTSGKISRSENKKIYMSARTAGTS